LMDRNKSAIVWEVFHSGLGLYFLYTQDDWFGANIYLSYVKYILGAYFILSIIVTGWFAWKHEKEDVTLSLSKGDLAQG